MSVNSALALAVLDESCETKRQNALREAMRYRLLESVTEPKTKG